MNHQYRLKTINENFGNHTLTLEVLEDLNKTIDELFTRIDQGEDQKLLEDLCPYFGVVWPAARALSEHLASLGTSTFEGRKVLEVGCGLAIPSLLLAKYGAHVLATDFHPEVPKFLDRNKGLNNVNLEYLRLDWREAFEGESAKLVKQWGHFDWVIGSDILYEQDHPENVATVLAEFAGKKGRIVIADPMRPYLQKFVDAMTRLGFRHDAFARTIPDSPAAKDVMLFFFQKT